MQGQLGALGDLGAGRHILFLNTKGVDGKISTDLEALFEYINANEQWRIEYMKYYFDMQDQYAKGVAEGAAKYEAKAKEKEAQSVKNFYSKNIPLETISECTGLSLDEVNKIISTKQFQPNSNKYKAGATVITLLIP